MIQVTSRLSSDIYSRSAPERMCLHMFMCVCMTGHCVVVSEECFLSSPPSNVKHISHEVNSLVPCLLFQTTGRDIFSPVRTRKEVVMTVTCFQSTQINSIEGFLSTETANCIIFNHSAIAVKLKHHCLIIFRRFIFWSCYSFSFSLKQIEYFENLW